MADILIRGMEMPNDWDLWLCIDTDGTVYNVKPVITGTAQEVGTAIPLPEGHGRLIDADALLNNNGVGTQIAGWGKMFHETAIAYAPIIVPAEGGGKE